MLGAVVAAGTALRLLFMLAYRPAFLGYPDTLDYVVAARGQPFHDPLRASGYPLFLRAIHAISADLSFTILVQHAMGMATAALLYACVRRAGAPRWLAAIPAAVVVLGGSQLFLEHAVLSEPVYTLLTAAGLYAAIRALDAPALPWCAAAGGFMGAAGTVRLAGLALLPLAALFLIVARDGIVAARAGRAAAALGVGAVVIFGYLVAAHGATGRWGLPRSSAYHFYGRVAPFADCSRFKPPAGTRPLCESTPPSRRPGPLFYIFETGSPAIARFSQPPILHPTAAELRKVRAFSIAAVEHQPLDYLEAVGRDLWRYVWPSALRRAYASPGPADYAKRLLLDQRRIDVALPHVASYYSTDGVYVNRSLYGFLRDYERVTRLEGPAIFLLLMLALVAPLACTGRLRKAAMLLSGAAAALMILPVMAIDYDGRFAVPANGPLAAAAVVGAAGTARRIGRNTRSALPAARSG